MIDLEFEWLFKSSKENIAWKQFELNLSCMRRNDHHRRAYALLVRPLPKGADRQDSRIYWLQPVGSLRQRCSNFTNNGNIDHSTSYCAVWLPFWVASLRSYANYLVCNLSFQVFSWWVVAASHASMNNNCWWIVMNKWCGAVIYFRLPYLHNIEKEVPNICLTVTITNSPIGWFPALNF